MIRELHENLRGICFSLMGRVAPPIFLEGDKFLHEGRFQLPLLLKLKIDDLDPDEILNRLNTRPYPKSKIYIPSPPSQISKPLKQALQGGVVHECLHGLYTCRRNFKIEEIPKKKIKKYPFEFARFCLNVVEDIRIERISHKKHPTFYSHLEALQDYIVEREDREELDEAMKTLLLIRDLGLGYTTPQTLKVLDWYKERNFTLDPKYMKAIEDMELFDETSSFYTTLKLLDYFDSDFDLPEEIKHPEPIEVVSEALAVGREGFKPYSWGEDVIEYIKVLPRLGEIRYLSLFRDIEPYVVEIKNRMKQKIKAHVLRGVQHGLARGSVLSERDPFFVESFLEVKNKQFPTRPYSRVVHNRLPATAVCVLVDESSSTLYMQQHLQHANIALSYLMDSLSVPTFSFGLSTLKEKNIDIPNRNQYTRTYPIHIRIYKDFNESYDFCKVRYTDPHSKGLTPLGEGIEYGLSALKKRSEPRKWLLVLTDGMPDRKEIEGIRNMLASERSVYILGIGITQYAKDVETLFPNSLYVEDPKRLYVKLIEKIEEEYI